MSLMPDDQARLVFSVRTPVAGERRIPGMPEEDTDTGTVDTHRPSSQPDPGSDTDIMRLTRASEA